MRPKGGISETYVTRFESTCDTCEHRSDKTCSYSGALVDDIKFRVRRYFGLSVPSPIYIPCPVFAELKRGYDEEKRQVPVGLALERARRGVGQRPWVGEKLRNRV